MSKNSGGGTQTQVSKTELPAWVNSASEANYGRAQDVANNLAPAYSGARVADMSPDMARLIQQGYGNVGASDPAFAQAQGTTAGLTGYNAPTVTPNMLAGTNLQPYLNPYTDAVINPAMQQMEQSRKLALNQVGDQAAQSKAFGGSRQGIAEGVTNAQSELAKGQFVSGLQMQNFNQAQQAATGDITRDMSAQQLNQQAGLASANFRGSMANQQGQLATGQQQNFLQGLQAAMAGQGMVQQQDQAHLDANRQQYEENRQYPIQQLQILQSALGQSPYGQTQTTTKPGPTTDSTGQIMGLAGSVIGAAGMAF